MKYIPAISGLTDFLVIRLIPGPGSLSVTVRFSTVLSFPQMITLINKLMIAS